MHTARASFDDAPRAVSPPARRPRRVVVLVVLGVLAVAAAAGLHMARMMSRPVPPPDVGAVKLTANGRYRVLFVPAESPAPMLQVHSWLVRVERPDGSAVDGPAAPLAVSVDGGMPQHGHGLPTTPRAVGRLPDGRVVVGGMKFSMPGWWELRLRVDGTAGTDSVTFNLIL